MSTTGSISESIKIVYWDLDGTLWPGIAGEDDSAGALTPDGALVGVIGELDGRGILNSIASQASRVMAVSILRRHNLAELFVAPRFDIANKAAAIASSLNELGLLPRNAAFIDDLAFYRAEVSTLLPEVLVLTPEEATRLPDHPRIRHTAQSPFATRRRELYQEESMRREAERAHAGDRAGFLTSCYMRFTCCEVDESTGNSASLRARVAELLARAHRLSLSGGTTRQAVPPTDRQTITFAGHLVDKFGDYGVIAVAVGSIEESDNNYDNKLEDGRLVDSQTTKVKCLCVDEMAVSCRVQGRGIVEAFLWWLSGWRRARELELVLGVDTASEANLPLRSALRLAGFYPTVKTDTREVLSCRKPELLRLPAWISISSPLGEASPK